MCFGMADQSARVQAYEIFLCGFELFGTGPLSLWSLCGALNVFFLPESTLNVSWLGVYSEDVFARSLNQRHTH